jgi:hypothetical protein
MHGKSRARPAFLGANPNQRKVKMTSRAMKQSGFVLALGLLASACGQSRAGMRADNPRLLASGPAATDVTHSAPARQTIAPIPVHVLRHPADRLVMMERMRMQIVNKTREVPAQRYAQVVRPELRHELLAMGFQEDDADYILWDADRAR